MHVSHVVLQAHRSAASFFPIHYGLVLETLASGARPVKPGNSIEYKHTIPWSGGADLQSAETLPTSINGRVLSAPPASKQPHGHLCNSVTLWISSSGCDLRVYSVRLFGTVVQTSARTDTKKPRYAHISRLVSLCMSTFHRIPFILSKNI